MNTEFDISADASPSMLDPALDTTFVMIDDNEDDIFITRRKILRDGGGSRFVSHRSPRELFDFLQSLVDQGYDKRGFLVLLDVNMPHEHGFKTLRRIRAHREFADLPVVIFSGSEDDSDKRQALELGADAFVVKPFSTEQFYRALAAAPRLAARFRAS